MHVRTDVRAPAFSVDGVHCRHYEHKPEKECKEQEGIEKHSIRNPPRPNFHFDEFSNTFPWEHCDMPQTGWYVKLHLFFFLPRNKQKTPELALGVWLFCFFPERCYFIWQPPKEEQIWWWIAKNPYEGYTVKGRSWWRLG